MEIQHLSIDQVRAKESKYRFCQVTDWAAEDRELKPLVNSIQEWGILQPLFVHRVGEVNHLVDGFKRAVIARALGIEDLPCRLFPEDISLRALLELLLIEHRHKICATLAAKVRFIDFALKLGLEKDPLVRWFFPMLDLQGHEAVLTKVKAIAQLPEEILDFCAEKYFSMRQCAQLTRYPRDLLLHVFSWRDRLSMTASVVEEMLSHLHDQMRGTGQDLSEFLNDREVQGLLASSSSLHEKTEQFRALIRERRYPILTDTNRKLQRIRDQISLPRNATLTWDPTLERREVQLVLKFQESSEWEETLQALKDEKIAQGFHRLLEIL